MSALIYRVLGQIVLDSDRVTVVRTSHQVGDHEVLRCERYRIGAPRITSEGSGLGTAERLVGTSEGELGEGVKRGACEGSVCEDL